MIAIEQLCLEQRPDLLLVAGDVNSTLAAALAAAKLHIPIAHIEAGLRSKDRTMPEEINRIVVDQLSDLLFTTEEAANDNLAREGISSERVHFVGNCMVDTLLQHVDTAVGQAPWRQWDLDPTHYAVATLHRPSNVDDAAALPKMLQIINNVAYHLPVLFPVHPRTRTKLAQTNVLLDPRVVLTEPLGYLPFLGLMARAAVVLTDSGGIQEETTALGVPCLTLRNTTERPVTITHGTNLLIRSDAHLVEQSIAAILGGTWKRGTRPALWDGHAAERIVAVIQQTMNNEQ
jgi:UDP-N-acetylglucosamine 2-epimerase (non-hydrolysing)